jgi:hypothetical protein
MPNPIQKLQELAYKASTDEATQEEVATLGEIVLSMIPYKLFAVSEDGANGWTVTTEEIVGRYCYVLFRTLPDGRFVHLELLRLHKSAPMAQIMAEEDDRSRVESQLKASVSRLEEAICSMNISHRGLRDSVDGLGEAMEYLTPEGDDV